MIKQTHECLILLVLLVAKHFYVIVRYVLVLLTL